MTATVKELQEQRCRPCEGGVSACSLDEAQRQVKELEGWEVSPDGKRIQKTWNRNNFITGMQFLNAVAELAESEGHHPDVHLEGYRHVRIELTTHAIGGLSENDFILAAKIDGLG